MCCNYSEKRNCLIVASNLTKAFGQRLTVDEQCQQLLSDRSSFYCAVSITTTRNVGKCPT